MGELLEKTEIPVGKIIELVLDKFPDDQKIIEIGGTISQESGIPAKQAWALFEAMSELVRNALYWTKKRNDGGEVKILLYQNQIIIENKIQALQMNNLLNQHKSCSDQVILDINKLKSNRPEGSGYGLPHTIQVLKRNQMSIELKAIYDDKLKFLTTINFNNFSLKTEREIQITNEAKKYFENKKILIIDDPIQQAKITSEEEQKMQPCFKNVYRIETDRENAALEEITNNIKNNPDLIMIHGSCIFDILYNCKFLFKFLEENPHVQLFFYGLGAIDENYIKILLKQFNINQDCCNRIHFHLVNPTLQKLVECAASNFAKQEKSNPIKFL